MGLLYHPDALKGLLPQDAKRIKDKIDWLWANRRVVNHFPLRENLSGWYKRRIARFRIIYTYDANPDDMVICLVGSRDDIYNRPL